MNKVTRTAAEEINYLEKKVPAGKHIVTGEIRKLSSRLYREIENKSADNIFAICEELLNQHNWAMGVIAFDLAYRVKKQYNGGTYSVFYHWLKEYVRGWGDCDDFCTHAFGTLLMQDKSIFGKIKEWTLDNDFWVRRASAVILIPAILRDAYEGLDPLFISDALMEDENDLVLKGYGWMLKALSQADRELVEGYLIENHKRIPRVAYRYALEKFDKETRDKLMRLV